MEPRVILSTELLRDARERRGLSQVAAAEAVGISRATLQNAEAGRFTPRADVLARMADLYGISLDSLFTHNGEPGTDGNGAGEGPAA
jgi:transcriptional regulator with XRE-family HTH domain